MPGQPLGASNQLARPLARPRSPRALTLPIMNIIAGLPVPVISLRNSAGPSMSERSGASPAPFSTVQVPSVDEHAVGVAGVARAAGDPEVDARRAVAGLVGAELVREAREDGVEQRAAVLAGEVVADLLVGRALDQADELGGRHGLEQLGVQCHAGSRDVSVPPWPGRSPEPTRGTSRARETRRSLSGRARDHRLGHRLAGLGQPFEQVGPLPAASCARISAPIRPAATRYPGSPRTRAHGRRTRTGPARRADPHPDAAPAHPRPDLRLLLGRPRLHQGHAVVQGGRHPGVAAVGHAHVDVRQQQRRRG